MDQDQIKPPSFWQKNAIIVKVIFIVTLSSILLIPVSLVNSTLTERQYRKQDVIQEVSSKWGRAQTIVGPVLVLPYKVKQKISELNAKGTYSDVIEETVKNAYFLPDDLDISVNMTPRLKKRSIYEVVLYESKTKIKGKFLSPNLKMLSILPENVIWEKAHIILALNDLKGLGENPAFLLNSKKVDFESGGVLSDEFKTGLKAPFVIVDQFNSELNFDISLELKGSESIRFVPLGKKQLVKLSAPWPHPNFEGEFLPEKHESDKNGFSAVWKTLSLSRNFPQQWTGASPRFEPQSFGVKLIQTSDNYIKSDKAIKYAILIISLTFFAVLFFELRNKKSIHFLNYGLIGMALCIFYTLLVSISEYLDFNGAYGIATAMTVVLIFSFAKSLFADSRAAISISAVMTTLYGFILVILQLEDTALLVGSLGLFSILAVVMYVSRNIDFQRLK
ncbi:MAG: cell envelope integrity protein CreD [Leadbetterella sp.]